MMRGVHPVMSTTPTQCVLGVCFLLIGPAFGIAASDAQFGRRRVAHRPVNGCPPVDAGANDPAEACGE